MRKLFLTENTIDTQNTEHKKDTKFFIEHTKDAKPFFIERTKDAKLFYWKHERGKKITEHTKDAKIQMNASKWIYSK